MIMQWEKIVERTGERDLDKIEAIARTEIGKWTLKITATKNESGYFIIPEEKWMENQQIMDRRKRLLHFMLHAFYVGDEHDQKPKSTIVDKELQLLYGRWFDHTRRLNNTNGVDVFMIIQRLNNVESNGIYYDPVPEQRSLHLVGESISIGQRRVLDLSKLNIEPLVMQFIN